MSGATLGGAENRSVERRAPLRRPAVVYPESDGEPMAESDLHRDEMIAAIDALRRRYRGKKNIYVSGDNFIYYKRGVPSCCVSPDTYVVKGVHGRRRRVYKTWEEGGAVPCFVLEVTSDSTREEDLGRKMMKYRDDLRVPEYFLFDPLGEWIPERLRGYVLRDGIYLAVEMEPPGRLPSRELGLELGIVDGHVRFFRPRQQEPIPTSEELADREERERERANRAERELAKLRAELARSKRPRRKRRPP